MPNLSVLENSLLKRGRTERPTSNRLRVGSVELDQDTHEVWRDGELSYALVSSEEERTLRRLAEKLAAPA